MTKAIPTIALLLLLATAATAAPKQNAKHATGTTKADTTNQQPGTDCKHYYIPKADSLPLSLSGAVFANMPYIKDDNPNGFTQTYLRLSFFRFCKKEFDTCKKGLFSAYPFRNFFGQVLYSTNAPDIKPIYRKATGDTTQQVAHINKLDLYRNASFHATLLQNIVTLSSNDRKYWKTNIYIDGMAELIRTNIADSVNNENKSVTSWLIGANVKARFRKIAQHHIFGHVVIEPYAQLFWVNPISNSFNYNQNIQSDNKSDLLKYENPKRPFTVNPQAYLRAGVLFIYTLNKSDDENEDKDRSSVFINIAHTSNFFSPTKEYYHNSYFQAQLGLRINFKKVLQGVGNNSKKNKSENKADLTPTETQTKVEDKTKDGGQKVDVGN